MTACNALNNDFGYPMTVCTNEWSAPSIKLVTNVKLPDGKVHLELADATGQFTVWYLDHRTWEYRKLLDISRDGSIDDVDSAAWLDHRTFYYWTNQVTIRGDRIGQTSNSSPNCSDANHHENASNAFVVASQIASTIKAIPGEKVVMAHSLGNMEASP